jgi:hypothetical protein
MLEVVQHQQGGNAPSAPLRKKGGRLFERFEAAGAGKAQRLHESAADKSGIAQVG